MSEVLDALQWPAMAITIAAAWFVGSKSERRRKIGFWGYMVGNVLWVAWGFHTQAWALVVLQFCLAAMNIRGVRRNDNDG